MDWAANWYQEELDAKADLAGYDPLVTAEAHLSKVVLLNRILTVVRPGSHPEGAMPVIRRIRAAYWQTYKAWHLHNVKMRRGWSIPDWDDPFAVEPVAAGKRWSVEKWLDSDRLAAQTAFSTQLTIFHERNADMRRAERRTFNTTATLYVFECGRLAWALDPDKQ